ncbi:hypothetical protein LVB87_14445 [Lysobacter sp. KIS68-7]|uniref:hypothetical protein n=1 Tax=Lysobacter sp. KIS68-7 TaxID=2904252 RepID=UPI001E2E43C5|nr:hypothetical protein [Lysobacter sp. KIS68-7]UHQ19367.1 hypothetical protein LVB87_14445 [Lysobacter sp. KIS68-7]
MTSKRLALSEMARAYLEEMRALGIDDRGYEVFVGLSREESKRYHWHQDQWILAHLSGKPRPRAEIDEHVALREKHEIARLQCLG